jgi:broad specificity phosphatase PhoE
MNKILLVRHGESESNVNPKVFYDKPDVAIELTEKGTKQAVEAGQFISKYLEQNPQYHNVIIHNSSYQRALDTSNHIAEYIRQYNCGQNIVRTFSDSLVEIIQGNFITYHAEGLKAYEKQNKKELDYWKIQNKDQRGTFFSKRPIGESYFDVTNRLQHEIMNSKQIAKLEDTLFVIVAHGAVNRCFAKSALFKSIEWFNTIKNPKNCDVWELDYSENKLNQLFTPTSSKELK